LLGAVLKVKQDFNRHSKDTDKSRETYSFCRNILNHKAIFRPFWWSC